MSVSKVQQMTAIDNIGPRTEDSEEQTRRNDLGRRLYHAACAGFKQRHGINTMPAIAEIIEREISPNRESTQRDSLMKKAYFTLPHHATSGRCIVELDGDMLVILGWRKYNPNSGIKDLAVKVVNPDKECIAFLEGDETLDQYNITAIGERYEVGRPDHPYKKED